MTTCGSLRGIGISFLFLGLGLVAEASSAHVDGLKFDRLQEVETQKSPIQDSSTRTEDPQLNDLLQESNFENSSIEQIRVQFQEEGVKSDVVGVEFSNKLDAETSEMIKKASEANTSRVQDHLNPHHKSLGKCYLSNDEMPTDQQVQGSFAEKLRVKLARDALHIANTHTNHRTRESTTCLCVVLRTKEENMRKLMLHSGKRVAPSIKNKASELGYMPISYKGHSEAQFINFLLDCTDTTQYTHILGMGCSRLHCRECNSLLKLGFGKGYDQFTAAMQEESSNPQVPTFENTENYKRVILKVPDKAKENYVVSEKESAIRKSARPSNTKYDLNEAIQNWIMKLTGWNLTSHERFNS